MAQSGAFFTPGELLAVFPRLKRFEAGMGEKERAVLIKIEKVLYDNLSIREIESGLKAYVDLNEEGRGGTSLRGPGGGFR
ncbi:MAG: hypothetical protein LBI67_07475 [Treponema sp.]|jgi:hypothetical protein|nr:hypothetical protein [Treponema sp.]